MDDPLEQFRKNFFGILEKEKLEKEKALNAIKNFPSIKNKTKNLLA